MNNDKIIAAIAPAFTALMIEKIQNLKTGWNKPWVSMAQGCPVSDTHLTLPTSTQV